MDEQRFNMSMRMVLKVVGVISQHEIERLVLGGLSIPGHRHHVALASGQ
jgi:hypothetical protein